CKGWKAEQAEAKHEPRRNRAIRTGTVAAHA
ncbi:MAG: hypothetical protein RLZZ22_13, partial [Pseudomonadota bacterium]